MRYALVTDTADFAKEMVDVISLFFEAPEQDEAAPQLRIVHTDALAGDVRTSRVSLQGAYCARAETAGQAGRTPLEDKRLHKRQVKTALYRALRDATGIRPPWGSLTGIRPTRLVYAQMERGKTLEEACAWARDTFDLVEDKRRLLQDVVAAQQATLQPRACDVDIYVGIPFCTTRCRYCSFISAQVGSGRLLAPYTDALIAETARVRQLMAREQLGVRAFYMGGGTPTALPAPLLDRVLTAAQPWLDAAAEATVEAGRPDTIDRARLNVLRAHGVRRISINPQTMHDSTLQTIGRAHTRAQTEDAYALARAMGFDRINMDLIAGLPGEDLDMFRQTLAWAEGLRPENLTVHSLSVKRSSDMHRWADRLPNAGMVEDMMRARADTARRMGMRPYYLYRQKHMAGNLENVGYARPGMECLYNIDTMEDTVSILALGAGGISKRVWPGRTFIMRAPNVKEIAQYMERVEEMCGRRDDLWRKTAPAYSS